MREKLWDVEKGHKFDNFKTMSSNPLKHLNREKKTWMTDKIKQYKMYRQLQEDVSDSEAYDSDASSCTD